MTALPRLVPDEPLPPYSYVSGLFPHPVRDPAGHSHGQVHAPAAPLVIARWHDCREYLAGIDLFNAGYYWEAHEHWEAVWHAVGRHGPIADLLKGLIKLAAAGVKAREGRPEGVARHARRAAELLESAQAALASSRVAGINLHEVQEAAMGVATHPAEILDDRPLPVVVVMPFSLRLETGNSG